MKKRDLLRSLRKFAQAADVDFELVRNGASHDVFRLGGVTHEEVPGKGDSIWPVVVD